MDALFALPYGPIVIFALRLVDVSLGTVRMIVTVRGRRGVAALIGFVEVLIWFVAVGHALEHLGSLYHVVGYAAGFAAGTYAGVVLENGLALGTVVVRAIIPEDPGGATAQALRDEGFVVTEVDGRGRDGPVDILNAVVGRKEAAHVIDLIESQAPRSFVTVEELRTTYHGTLPLSNRRSAPLVRR